VFIQLADRVEFSREKVVFCQPGFDQKHYWKLLPTGSQQQEQGELQNTPEAVETWPPAYSSALGSPNRKFVQVADVKAMDSLSGLAPGSFKVSINSSESSDPGNPDMVVTPDGSGGYFIQLRADRSSASTGRVYTISAVATDGAGNTASVAATCTVPHDQSH
jgi:hypothetical protein